jgi:DNA polymerase III epsilon subunit-like protein
VTLPIPPAPSTPPARSWLDEPWCIIDTETTGLTDPAVVELGAVIMHRGQVIDWGSEVYHPGRPIDPAASAVHGITIAMVALAPRLDAASAWSVVDPDAPPTPSPTTPLARIGTWARAHGARTLVAYNGLGFDFELLAKSTPNAWPRFTAHFAVVADPLVLVRTDVVGRFWKGSDRHRLASVAERSGLTDPVPGMASQAHRAAWDCVLAGRVLWHLRDAMPEPAIVTRTASAWFSATYQSQRADFERWLARQPPPQA